MRNYFFNIKQYGQGMTEYIIIVALIAVAAIAVTQLFGATIRNQMAGISQEIAGEDGTTARASAKGSADKAVTAGTTNKSLETYTKNKTEGAQ